MDLSTFHSLRLHAIIHPQFHLLPPTDQEVPTLYMKSLFLPKTLTKKYFTWKPYIMRAYLS